MVGTKVCELTEDLLWFVCGNSDVSPKLRMATIMSLGIVFVISYYSFVSILFKIGFVLNPN